MTSPMSGPTIAVAEAGKLLSANNELISVTQAKEIIRAAIQIKQRAYCPYSKFQVGAAVLALPAEGLHGDIEAMKPVIFTGVNVENASYPVGTCAERCAIGTAVTAGYTRIIAIAVSANIEPPASPCGMCRQFIREFVADMKVPIVMLGGEAAGVAESEKCAVMEFGQLLPVSFGPEALPKVNVGT